VADPSEVRGVTRWKRLARAVADRARSHNLTLVSAGVAFFSFLSLFPALIALVSIYGLVADPGEVAGQVDRLSDALPAAAQTLVRDQLHEVVASNRAGLSIGVVVGIAIALWGASTALQQLLIALEGVDGQPRDRGYAAQRLRAFGLTLAAMVFVTLTVILLTVAPSLGNDLAGPAGRTFVSLLRWPLLVTVFAFALGLLYRRTTGSGHAPARLFTWGVLVATVVWSAASVLFSIYVTTFGSYNKTYGSLAAVAILMLWLFLTALCILLGAEVNAVGQRDDPAT
jgi:membrane protein